MSLVQLKLLILVLIATDFFIIFAFIFITRRLKSFNSRESFDRQIKIFESMLADADKVSDSLRKELEEKRQTIKKLNQKLDTRIVSLKVLLKRADAMQDSKRSQPADNAGAAGGSDEISSLAETREKQIIKMARKGYHIEKIAGSLSIPREEVKFIMDLHKNIDSTNDKVDTL